MHTVSRIHDYSIFNSIYLCVIWYEILLVRAIIRFSHLELLKYWCIECHQKSLCLWLKSSNLWQCSMQSQTKWFLLSLHCDSIQKAKRELNNKPMTNKTNDAISFIHYQLSSTIQSHTINGLWMFWRVNTIVIPLLQIA